MAIEVSVNIGATELELQVTPGLRDVYFEGGSGTVVGPASSVNNNLAKFGDTSGDLIADSGISASSVQTAVAHVSATTGAHGMTAFGASVVAAANASAVRDLIDLNTTDTPSFDEITVDTVNFDTAAAETVINEGELTWDNDEKTLYLGLANSAHIHLGHDTIYYAENNTGSTIPKGTLVCFAGTVGGSGKVRVTPWTGAQQPYLIMGITSSEIAAGAGNPGVVVHFGKVRGINTTGTPQSETWAVGDVLYAKSSGGLTKTKPTSAPIVTVAAVTNVSASNGTLRVRVDIGQNAADVGAVALNANANTLSSTGATNGQVLTANGSGAASWQTVTASGSGDVTGPSLSVNDHVVLFNGITGKLIKSAGYALGDAAAKNTGTSAGTVAAGDHNHNTNKVGLTTAVSGVLPVANGGTGQSSLGAVDAADLGSGLSTNGQVLTSDGTGNSSWNTLPTSMVNPMTQSGDIIYGGASGAPQRLGAPGINGKILKITSGVPSWQDDTGFANPMDTPGDIIYGGTSGAATKLGIGASGKVLKVSGGYPSWQDDIGFADPMDTAGDLIYRNGSNVTTRLASGSGNNGKVLAVSSGVPGWVTPSSAVPVGTETVSTAGTGGSATTLGSIHIGKLVLLDTTTGAIDFKLTGGTVGDYLWVSYDVGGNAAQLTRDTGVELRYQANDADIVLTFKYIYFLWLQTSNVWRVLSAT